MTAPTGTDERARTEFPIHPEAHVMRWSDLEIKCIKKYADECVLASLGAAQVPAGFVMLNALREAEAGLEFAAAARPQTTEFVPSHVAALKIVREALAGAAQVPAPTKDEIQAAFETWLYRVCPSGDVTEVQRKWEASSDYDELFQPQPVDEVRIPTGENEAALMAILGTNWLAAHAPHRLKSAGAAQVPSLSDADMRSLRRFQETAEDDQSYDIGKKAVQSLANVGALRYAGGSRYEVTIYGKWVLSQPSQQGTK